MVMQLSSSLIPFAAMPSLQKYSILVLCIALTARTTLSAPQTVEENIPVEGPDDTTQAEQATSISSDPILVTSRPLPSQYSNEAPCLRQGGLCIKKDECPKGSLHPTSGLCPQQAHLGVECCHGLSVMERRCSARGGECRPRSKCGRMLWEKNAEDCKANEACCILTRLL